MKTHLKSYDRPYGVSVFFPAFNDEDSIARLIHEALDVAPRITNDYEVIVVNDGSSDGTAAVLNDLASREPRLRVIHHPRNRGYGGALRSGFENATKDLIFYTDGDGQYDVREMANLIPLMIEDVDVVTGYKIRRSDSRHRIVLGAIYKFLARRMFGLPVRDVDCDFRLMRREAIQSVTLTSTSGVVCTEMVYKLSRAGYHFAETPVHHYPRMHGQSQFFTLRRVARTGYDFFSLWLKLVIFSTQGRTEEESEKRCQQSERRQKDSVNGLIDPWRAPPDRQHDEERKMGGRVARMDFERDGGYRRDHGDEGVERPSPFPPLYLRHSASPSRRCLREIEGPEIPPCDQLECADDETDERPHEESSARFPSRLRNRKCEGGAGDRILDYSSDKQSSEISN